MRGYNGHSEQFRHSKRHFGRIYFSGHLMDASSVANLNWGYVGTNMGFGGMLLDNPLTNHREASQAPNGGTAIYRELAVKMQKFPKER
jgi:hypothetical protein